MEWWKRHGGSIASAAVVIGAIVGVAFWAVDSTVDRALEPVREDIHAFDVRLVRVEERMVRVEERMIQVEERMIRVEERVGRVEERVVRIEERMDGIDDRLARIEDSLTLLLMSASPGSERASVDDARDMVARAVSYYDEAGAEAAFAKINTDPEPDFRREGVYAWVVGPDDTLVAHSVDPSLLGSAIEDFIPSEAGWLDRVFRTADGTAVRGSAIEFAERGEASWIVPHDGHLFAAAYPRPE